MKAWFHIFLSAILLMTWISPSNSKAISSSTIASWKTTLAASDTKIFIQSQYKTPFAFKFVDAQGKTVSDIVSNQLRPSDLPKFLPSQIAKDLKDTAKFSAGRIALQKLKRFPIESIGFFISLGALMTYDLIFNPAKNPAGFEQLVDSQLDPVGMIAFYAFMVSAGIASEPFLEMIKDGKINRRLKSFFVYGGMSIGMVASNLVHEMGHWPDMWKCARDRVFNQQLDLTNSYASCDAAMKTLAEKGGPGGISKQWVPGLISLVISTIAAGYIQNFGMAIISPITKGVIGFVVKSGNWTLGKILQTTGIELGLLFIPGAMVIKGMRIVGSVATLVPQFTLFNGVQFWVEHIVSDSFNNWDLSGNLKEMDSRFFWELSAIKDHKWPNFTTEQLGKKIEEFSQLMKKWRQLNMSQVLSAQANWEQKFGQMTLMYRSTHNFYSDFITRLWERKHGRYSQSYLNGTAVSILDRSFPLNGVTVAKAETDDATTWLAAPEMIEARQKNYDQ